MKIELIKCIGEAKDIVNAARASFGKRITDMGEADWKLLRRLLRDKHYSTLEHTQIQFYVECPLYIRSQWMRHRVGWSYNERSGRYCEPTYNYYTPKLGSEWQERQFKIACDDAITLYKQLLSMGNKKEDCRGVLPQCMMTSFIATCNLRSFLHFFELRATPHAQKEIRELALSAMEQLKNTTLGEVIEIYEQESNSKDNNI